MKKHIYLADFFKTGKLPDVNFGDNKAKIIKIFGNPGEYGIWKCDDKTEIINYGRSEFYFFEDKLFQIFSDGWFKNIDFGKNIICDLWFKNIDFGKNIICDFWILKNLSRCTLKYFLKKLQQENIEFEAKKTKLDIQIILKNKIELYFEPRKKFAKENNYKLSAFCLTEYE